MVALVSIEKRCFLGELEKFVANLSLKIAVRHSLQLWIH